jgi:hypothetical protein
MNIDGYFYYEEDLQKQGGLWAAWSLRLIADELDEINEPWDRKVNAYFESEKIK